MKYNLLLFIFPVFAIGGCHEQVDLHLSEIRVIPHPSISGGQPYLVADQSGHLYSSWLEYINDSLVALQYSSLQNGHWSPPQSIAEGEDWFVNWADFPTIAVNENWMAAHWLQYRGTGTYEYDVQIAIRKSEATWSRPITPHSDGVAAEHGFASMTPIDKDHILAVWLDGRNTVSDDSFQNEHGHGQGAMTLRSAMIDKHGNLTQETELDNRVCDCCQTGLTMTQDGPLVVYRNRTQEEIRDIYVVRRVDGKWQEPHPIYVDGWKTGGCPVNGPAVDAIGNLVAVAWFTMANDSARVKMAFSADGGSNFDRPLTISDTDPLGRVEVAFLDKHNVLITWVENKNQAEAEILGVIVRNDFSRSEIFKLVKTSPERRSGFPKIATTNGQVYLSWTEVNDGESRVQTAELLFDWKG